MVFFKLVHTEYQVNHKTQPFCGGSKNLRYQNSDTTLPHHKQMDLLKKIINMNLLFFDNKLLVLIKVFEPF